MKTFLNKYTCFSIIFIGIMVLGSPQKASAFFQEFTEYRGSVVDLDNNRPIASAYLNINGTNISTVTNSEGEFSLKVPVNLRDGIVTISSLGYISTSLPLSVFKLEGTRIELSETVEELSEVSIFTAKDPKLLVRTMFSKSGVNYVNDNTEMNVFYRESIRKRSRNVSLSEALLKIYKKPYNSSGRDEISIVKARKSVDYERLDTLALKLRGGPYNSLYSDIIKYPEYLFTPDDLEAYNFTFAEPTRINNRYLYVVNFEMVDKRLPWYFGQLFIDAQTNALVRATYNLNVENRNVASSMFVKKKPSGTRVYPIRVGYEVDYREKDGKWYYGYGSAELEFVVNWKRKLFNSRYIVNSEMAVTDWVLNPSGNIKRDETFIDPSVIMVDDVSGFTDLQFWGANNIIEPDKSIQNAIQKIKDNIN
ncbi:MAG TPA: carboxypeptidase-like regulatory domain-containing protein [Gillisia sp.]|nr:carboxypeptidase-like regulatory domain-containing protein [Gillisia sp.]